MSIEFDVTKVITVPIDKVYPNSWNPKQKNRPELDGVRKSLDANGLLIPIVVREVKLGQIRILPSMVHNGSEETVYEIIDGEQRWTVLKEKGATEITVYNEGTIDDAKAMELTAWFQQQVPFEETTLAKFLKSMVQEYGESLSVPYTPRELSDYIELADHSFIDPMAKVGENGEQQKQEFRSLNFILDEQQNSIVRRAIGLVQSENTDEVSDERAVELICGDYLGS